MERENREKFARPDPNSCNGATPALQRILLRTRVVPSKFVVRAYVVVASSTSILFGDVATTAGIIGILCATASLNGWKRVFPVFMCYVVVFWIATCSLILSGHYNPIFGIANIAVLFLSMGFSAISFVFFVASHDKIFLSETIDDISPSQCVGGIAFGVLAYIWPLYLSEFKRMPTPVAISIAGVISDMALFSFLALLCKPLVYVSSEEER